MVKIELKRENKESLWTTIDLEDLGRVINFPYTWHSAYDKVLDGYYAAANEYYPDEHGKYTKHRTVLLHMFVMEQKHGSGKHVDHINHDSLDNKKENLRVIEVNENATNRERRNKNNKSGYRNVAVVKGRYRVQIMINGRNTVFGTYDDPHEAGNVAEELRQKYYGDFAGAS